MNIECPKCKEEMDLEDVDLSKFACDSVEVECIHCDEIMAIGWYATAELR